jgi:hypothetical protein
MARHITISPSGILPSPRSMPESKVLLVSVQSHVSESRTPTSSTSIFAVHNGSIAFAQRARTDGHIKPTPKSIFFSTSSCFCANKEQSRCNRSEHNRFSGGEPVFWQHTCTWGLYALEYNLFVGLLSYRSWKRGHLTRWCVA